MYLFELLFSPDICPGVGLLDHVVVLYVVFWATSILFSIVVIPVYIPTSSVRGFPFLHTLQHSNIYCLYPLQCMYIVWRSMVAQQVKDSVLLLLCYGLNLWPRNFCILWVWPRKILHGMIFQSNILTIFFFFLPCPWHVEVPGPGIKSVPQQWSELQSWHIARSLTHWATWEVCSKIF